MVLLSSMKKLQKLLKSHNFEAGTDVEPLSYICFRFTVTLNILRGKKNIFDALCNRIRRI
jgi:hypothetical protein